MNEESEDKAKYEDYVNLYDEATYQMVRLIKEGHYAIVAERLSGMGPETACIVMVHLVRKIDTREQDDLAEALWEERITSKRKTGKKLLFSAIIMVLSIGGMIWILFR